MHMGNSPVRFETHTHSALMTRPLMTRPACA
jgi:hypothetical protein